MSQKCNCFEDAEKRGEKFVNVRNSLSFMSKIVYLHEQIFGVLVSLSFQILSRCHFDSTNERRMETFRHSMRTYALTKILQSIEVFRNEIEQTMISQKCYQVYKK